VKIFGLQTETVMGPPIAAHQLNAMEKHDAILYCVQLNVMSDENGLSHTEDPHPEEIDSLIKQYQSIFQPIPGLPPQHPGDHTIPLLQGAQPFRLRPYRYTPFQKDEIERQIQDVLKKGVNSRKFQSLFFSCSPGEEENRRLAFVRRLSSTECPYRQEQIPHANYR
jgi:hypothetical protein